MSLGVLAFLAGVLSVLAPCVLPVLPVILGSSLGAQKRYRPLVIVLSTGFFITFFTVVLKVSSLFIGVPQAFWVTFSSVIIIVYGLTLVRPELWEKVMMITGWNNANSLATKAKKHKGLWGDILLGAALGPIFASCSPTYALLLSIVFPKNFGLGVVYTIIYSIGFSLLLLVIAYGGRAVVQRLQWAANPKGWLKRILGGLLILTGVLIATGWIQAIQTRILSDENRDITRVEQRLLQTFTFGNKKNSACFTSTDGIYSCSGSAVQMTGENITSSKNSGSVAQKPGENPTTVKNDPREKLLNANYAAPEFAGLENRINTAGRTSIHELTGKVVIIDFRTYSCINCIRTLPYVEKLYTTYANKGLVVIGVHAPEFQFEHNIENVKEAVKRFGLTYPVVQDNNFATRRNYGNLYRPAKYIIDRQGRVRYTHFGEGEYEETEQVVQYLLGEDTGGVIHDEGSSVTHQQTPETYLGSARRARYSDQPTDTLHARRLQGDRQTESERIMLVTGTGSITINAYAKQVNLVLGTDTESVPADVFIDGKKTKHLLIDSYQLYNLMDASVAGKHTVEIRFTEPGVTAYAYTFG